MSLIVRELLEKDVPDIIDYWMNASAGYLRAMGADINKIPSRSVFETNLLNQLKLPYQKKSAYALIWENNGISIGHCNINKIIFAKEAYMHLHLWQKDNHQKGIGSALVKASLHYYFNNFDLQELYCEPYALNEAPNKTLSRVGFEFVQEHKTIPGTLNFEQIVKIWRMSKTRFVALQLFSEEEM